MAPTDNNMEDEGKKKHTSPKSENKTEHFEQST